MDRIGVRATSGWGLMPMTSRFKCAAVSSEGGPRQGQNPRNQAFTVGCIEFPWICGL